MGVLSRRRKNAWEMHKSISICHGGSLIAFVMGLYICCELYAGFSP